QVALRHREAARDRLQDRLAIPLDRPRPEPAQTAQRRGFARRLPRDLDHDLVDDDPPARQVAPPRFGLAPGGELAQDAEAAPAELAAIADARVPQAIVRRPVALGVREPAELLARPFGPTQARQLLLQVIGQW